ncbi:uncharacterized protein FTJAE_5168 [Fusarium tjaetaba]|uniref:Ubiquitin-like domain-containing protein n=1 Tax=Fusarium tjaetaba TaxID=1567544 RepID=A0A8H5VZ27_9HYPO|nr:uncharacterized protein FTJAE_5168 [Fusarium tjaetaba]KAF5638779.1 hypothetical protein FTJAE_5168 [Fusarium tjaetaba]
MDPLSIIASIAGIATAGTSLSKAIYHFISSTRGASREMADIAAISRICLAFFQNFAGWSFKRSEVQYKLTLIESHKTAIQLMLNIPILAATTRKEAQSQVTQPDSASEGKQKEPESEIPLLRQQSENLAYAASHCMVDLSDNESFETSQSSSQPKTDSDSEIDDVTGQVQVHGHGSSDGTGRWLFELIFESSYKHREGSETQEEQDTVKGHEGSAFDRTALAVRTPAELHIAIYEPGAGQLLVETLLADWTCLSKDEITGNIGIEDMIKQAFICLEVVYARHYDLMDFDGNLIDPSRWESTVEPGMQVVMTMWPMNKNDKPKPNLEKERTKVPGRRREKLESKKKSVNLGYLFGGQTTKASRSS